MNRVEPADLEYLRSCIPAKRVLVGSDISPDYAHDELGRIKNAPDVTFKKVAYALPFVHAVDAGKSALAGNYNGIFPHLWWVIGYATVISILAVLIFSKRMNSDAV
ncbi:MAG: hypothetical protein ACOX34_09340 [Bacillota bacterium]